MQAQQRHVGFDGDLVVESVRFNSMHAPRWLESSSDSPADFASNIRFELLSRTRSMASVRGWEHLACIKAEDRFSSAGGTPERGALAADALVVVVRENDRTHSLRERGRPDAPL